MCIFNKYSLSLKGIDFEGVIFVEVYTSLWGIHCIKAHEVNLQQSDLAILNDWSIVLSCYIFHMLKMKYIRWDTMTKKEFKNKNAWFSFYLHCTIYSKFPRYYKKQLNLKNIWITFYFESPWKHCSLSRWESSQFHCNI